MSWLKNTAWQDSSQHFKELLGNVAVLMFHWNCKPPDRVSFVGQLDHHVIGQKLAL
jgi:hypothetical protein